MRTRVGCGARHGACDASCQTRRDLEARPTEEVKMNALGSLKTISMITLLTALAANPGPARGADEQLRCEARALQIEAKVLHCVGSCRDREESRRWFDEERCLTKCESHYDEGFSELLCAADRRLVRSMDAASADDLRIEARALQDLSRSLRCTARCEDSTDQDACAARCDVKYRTELEITDLPLVY